MRKTFTRIFLSCFLVGSLSSCFEDEGNYDYDEPFKISVAGLQESYECYYMIDSLNIEPELSPKESDYDCFWGIYETNVQGYAPKLDTICHTRELHYKVAIKPQQYKLVFCAKDKKTGIPTFVQRDLQVTTPLSTGWFVLRTQNGKSDFDLFAPDNKKIQNVIATNNNGISLEGDATFATYSTKYKSWDPINERYVNTNTLFGLSSKGMVSMSMNDGKIIRDFDSFFYNEQSIKSPKALAMTFSDFYLVNFNQLYSIYGMSSNSGRFGESMIGDYKLSKHFACNDFAGPIFFDEKSSSFCTATAAGSNIIYYKDNKTECPSNQMDMDLLYMGSAYKNHWAIGKNKTSGSYLLLKLNPMAAYAGYSDVIISCQEISKEKGIIQATHWAVNQNNNIIYFNKDNVIYSCNIDANLAEAEQFKVPEGEEVTYMRNLDYKNWSNHDADFNLFVLATYDGEHYKVYLFDIQAGNLYGEPEILSGTGKVGALVYVDKNNSTAIR